MRGTRFSPSSASLARFGFWHAFGLVILRPPPSIVGWRRRRGRTWPVGGTVSILPDHGLDRVLPGQGITVSVEVKKMHVLRKAILAAACTAGLAVAATPGFAQTT